jgi:AraC-like DNA-binding protein
MDKTKSMKKQTSLTDRFRRMVDREINALRKGQVEVLPGIAHFADRLHVSPGHLSNTVKRTTGRSPCDFYEDGLVEFAKDLLVDERQSIGAVAHALTMDPSNFTKFFKRFVGVTPSEYRKQQHRIK